MSRNVLIVGHERTAMYGIARGARCAVVVSVAIPLIVVVINVVVIQAKNAVEVSVVIPLTVVVTNAVVLGRPVVKITPRVVMFVAMTFVVDHFRPAVKITPHVVIFAVMTFVVLQAKVVVTVNVVLNVVRIVVVKRINIAVVASRSINYAVRLMKFVAGISAIPITIIALHLAGRMTQEIQRLVVKTMTASVPAVSR